MSGERDLSTLLATMRAERQPGNYVFAVAPAGLDLAAVVTVREAEGLTVVVSQETADSLGLEYDYVAAWLTLRVHSALDAVGLTHAVSGRLAEVGISCNVVAGFYHDHLFVPADRADEALNALDQLAASAAHTT